MPTLARDFSNVRNVPSNVEIIKVGNPTGPFQIANNFFKHFSGFFSLLIEESKSTRIDFGVLKYLIYHIPLAIKVKNSIVETLQNGDNFSLYSYWMDTNAYALALLKKDLKSINFYMRSHGGDLYDERHPKGQVFFRKSVYEQVSLIAPVSKNGTQYIASKWPSIAPKTKWFPLGVKQQQFAPIPKMANYRLVSCSSILPLKRLEKILEVISQLPVSVEWVHLGGHTNRLNPFQELASQKLSNNQSFLPKGHLSNAEILNFYRHIPCDMFINLSSTEGVPVSMMEAISFGIPIISNDVGGVGEIVGEETGILVGVDDHPKAIAQEIMLFLENGKSRSIAFRKKTRHFWKTHYNAEKNYDLFLKEIDHHSCQV